MRVLKWMFERCEGKDNAVETPVGYHPKKGALDFSGLDLKNEKKLFEIDREAFKKEVKDLREYYKLFGSHLPKGITEELNALEKRLG